MSRPEHRQLTHHSDECTMTMVAQDLRAARRGSFYFGYFSFYFYAFTKSSHARVRRET